MDRRTVALRLAAEVAAPIVIALLTAGALSVALDAHGQHQFFYDGDSLVLPLFQQSLARGEPLQWVMSSQLFLLPELPFYLLCSLVAGGAVKAALVLNAILNAVVLSLLLRAASGRLRWSSPWARLGAPFVASLLFVAFLLLDVRGAQTNESIATFTVLTTYYYGATFVALAVLALALHATGGLRTRPRIRSAGYACYAVAAGLLLAVETVSNPLVVFQFAVPLGLALCLAVVLRWVPWRMAAVVLAPLAAAAVVGYAARFALGRYLLPGATSYVHLNQIPESIRFFSGVAVSFLSAPGGIAEAAVLALLLGACVAVLRAARGAGDAVLPLFVLCAVAVTLVGTVLVGSTATRYLGPVFVFPLLILVHPLLWRRMQVLARFRWPARASGVRAAGARAVGVRAVRVRAVRVRTVRVRAVGAAAAIAVAVAAIVAAAPAAGSLRAVTAAPGSPGLTCLENWIGDRSLTGEGSYWAVRALDLYGTRRVDVLQVDSTLGARAWMTDLASFDDRIPSYFIVDAPARRAQALTELGTPERVVDCGVFQIYDYSGTRGEATMTTKLASSIRYQLTTRGYPERVEEATRDRDRDR
ncbi:hypothetical protein GCM10027406_10680 [Leifsonia lichenia]